MEHGAAQHVVNGSALPRERRRPMLPVDVSRVLLVVREPVVARAFERAVERAGHEPVRVPSAAQALDVLAAEAVDLLVVEWRAAGGPALVRRARQGAPPFVAIVPADDAAVRADAARAGALACVPRDADGGEVALLLGRALDATRIASERAAFEREARAWREAALRALDPRVRHEVALACETTVPVVIAGDAEEGRRVARLIHGASDRAAQPLDEVAQTSQLPARGDGRGTIVFAAGDGAPNESAIRVLTRAGAPRVLVLAARAAETWQRRLGGMLLRLDIPPAPDAVPTPPATGVVLHSLNLRAAERALIERALEVTRGNRTRAAALLGLSVRALRAKLNR